MKGNKLISLILSEHAAFKICVSSNEAHTNTTMLNNILVDGENV